MEIKNTKTDNKDTYYENVSILEKQFKNLKISKSEYKKIFKVLNYSKYDDSTIKKVLSNITEYTKILNNLAKLRNVNIYNMSNADALDKIYRDLIKKRQDKIKNALLQLKLPNIVEKENISIKEGNKIVDLNKLQINDLRMRNIKNVEFFSKEELIYLLLKSDKSLYEDKYISNKNDKNELNYFIANFKLDKLSRYISKKERQQLRKELRNIKDKLSRYLSIEEKDKIKKELSKLIENLRNRNKYKHLDTYYDGLNHIENLFGITDDYYKPILSQQSFDDKYQRYTCRGDKNKKLSFNEYMDIVKPYIITLLNDTNKKETRKIQLDIRITTENILNPGDKRNFVVRSDNTLLLYTDDTTESVENLIKSLGEHYEEQILVSREGSNFRYSNIDSLNIHIHEIQLKRGSAYIETPDWIKPKKATTNPKNTHDNYCFSHSIVIAPYHKQRIEHLKPYYKHFN